MTDPVDLRVVITSRNGGLARTMRMALSGAGVRSITVAHDPMSTVRAIPNQEPHAVIIHVEGPENDEGVKLIRFLRRWEKSPNREIPIIAASASRDIKTINAVMNEGANEYVLLPPTGEALLKKVIACMTPRPFVEEGDYVGPSRRVHADATYPGPERRQADGEIVSAAQAAQEPSAAAG